MKRQGVKYATATQRLNWAANINPDVSDVQRQRCQKGLETAYGRS